jgi:hypothetical protein
VDFGAYIRRRRNYTETGLLLREALAELPADVQTPADLYGWLLGRGASLTVRLAAVRAAKQWRQMLRVRVRRSAASRFRA